VLFLERLRRGPMRGCPPTDRGEGEVRAVHRTRDLLPYTIRRGYYPLDRLRSRLGTPPHGGTGAASSSEEDSRQSEILQAPREVTVREQRGTMCYCSRTVPQLLTIRDDRRHLFRSGMGGDIGGTATPTVPSTPRICPKRGGQTRPGQEDKVRGAISPRQWVATQERPRQKRGKAALPTVILFATGR
jgi:hypothetical protein